MAGKPASLRRGTPYHPKRSQAARTRKRTIGPKQRARLERQEQAAARRRAGILSAPRTKSLTLQRQERALGPVASWPAEGRYLRERYRQDATNRALGRPHEGYAELYEEWVADRYRARYNEQQRARRAAKPKRKPERVRVRAHWRRVPR